MLWIAVVWLACHKQPELSHVCGICSAHVPVVRRCFMLQVNITTCQFCVQKSYAHASQEKEWDDVFNEAMVRVLEKKAIEYQG